MTAPIPTFSPSRPLTVGCIGTEKLLQQLDPIVLPQTCDWLEIRLDAMTASPAALRPGWKMLPLPLLFTARRGDEGGHRNLDAVSRRLLLEAVMEDAAAIDLEVASVEELPEVIELAKAQNLPLVLSAHDFEKTPDLATLRQTIARAREAGAAVAKIAAHLETPDDLARLANLLGEDHGIPLSLMGMGPLAPASRLLLAQLGSVLNYGYLGDTPTAPGQWSAARLKEAIDSVEIVPRAK